MNPYYQSSYSQFNRGGYQSSYLHSNRGTNNDEVKSYSTSIKKVANATGCGIEYSRTVLYKNNWNMNAAIQEIMEEKEVAGQVAKEISSIKREISDVAPSGKPPTVSVDSNRILRHWDDEDFYIEDYVTIYEPRKVMNQFTGNKRTIGRTRYTYDSYMNRYGDNDYSDHDDYYY